MVYKSFQDKDYALSRALFKPLMITVSMPITFVDIMMRIVSTYFFPLVNGLGSLVQVDHPFYRYKC